MLVLEFVSKFFLAFVPVLFSVAFVTLLERKVLSLTGLRVGPNKVSLVGFLQPIGDAVKLAGKQVNSLSNFNFLFYYSSSMVLLISALYLWGFFYFDPSYVSFKFSFLIFFMILSLNSFNSILSGWSTFSKYSLIGSVRTVSQLISYESSLFFCIFSLIFIFYSFSYQGVLFFYSEIMFVYLLPFFFIWVPSFLAELNRTPYDFSEGESELVSGFNTEFGSVGFTMLFLAEYANIMFFSLITSELFLGGLSQLSFFATFFFIIWIRSVLPRYRFDKLMNLAWKFFIPFLTLIFSCLMISN